MHATSVSRQCAVGRASSARLVEAAPPPGFVWATDDGADAGRPAAGGPDWGGDLAAEARIAVRCVQRAMQLCQALACDMRVVDSEASGKEMDECDVTAGVSFIKAGDSTPVTAADFAIQGLISQELGRAFPADRFMGEEDAGDLREDAALRSLALRLSSQYGGEPDEAAFLASVDRGLEPPRGTGERCWVLDPIDGTKGFMTGQNYVVGLALVDGDGEALVGVMGVPAEEEVPPIMAAVRGHGLTWWRAGGDAPVEQEAAPRPAWADGGAAPPWLISPQRAFAECQPFGAAHPPSEVCCGAMIKYFYVAAGRAAGFVQYEEQLKSWDHACGLICVEEAGGSASDCEGGRVAFPGRTFRVEGGVVCCSRWASEEVRRRLLGAATRR